MTSHGSGSHLPILVCQEPHRASYLGVCINITNTIIMLIIQDDKLYPNNPYTVHIIHDCIAVSTSNHIYLHHHYQNNENLNHAEVSTRFRYNCGFSSKTRACRAAVTRGPNLWKPHRIVAEALACPSFGLKLHSKISS